MKNGVFAFDLMRGFGKEFSSRFFAEDIALIAGNKNVSGLCKKSYYVAYLASVRKYVGFD